MPPPLAASPPVVVIDHDPPRRQLVATTLRAFYPVIEYADAARAVPDLVARPPRLVVIDHAVPPSGGAVFIRLMRQQDNLDGVPMVLLAEPEQEHLPDAIRQCHATAFLHRPFRRSALVQLVSSLLNAEVERRWDDLLPSQQAALRRSFDLFTLIAGAVVDQVPACPPRLEETFAPLVDIVARNQVKAVLEGVRGHDNVTYGHSLRVATLMTLFAYHLGLRRSDLLLVAGCGLLHDVGKLAIPCALLNKRGLLEADEIETLRGHVGATVGYLRAMEGVHEGIIAIAEDHHEKLDGTGYPRGLAGSQINELTRMATLVDIFSALTEERPYRPAFTPEQALTLMSEQMAGQLDRRLLALFGTTLLDTGLGR